MILVIKHIEIEGPETLGDFLKDQGESFEIIELGAGEKLPVDPKGYKAVIVLGGPMNVYEENIYPFLKIENDFIKKVLRAQIPYLGICLGAQLLAKAADGCVVKSPVKEIGWYQIQLTDEGIKDPLFQKFCPQDPVFQWHGDMFQLPKNGVLLARGEGCPYQAFRVGLNAYGLQFHVEITDKSIQEWAAAYSLADLPGGEEQALSMIDDYWKHKKVYDHQSKRLYQNFLTQILQRQNLPNNGLTFA